MSEYVNPNTVNTYQSIASVPNSQLLPSKSNTINTINTNKEDSPNLSQSSHNAFTNINEQNIKFDGATELFKGRSTKRGSYDEKIKQRIAAVREAYEHFGIIGNVIDLMVDFSLEGIDIVHTNRSIQKFYRAWASKINLYQTLEQILKCFFRDSNVPIFKYRAKIKPSEFKKLKKSVAQYEKGTSTKHFSDKEIESKSIPYAYKILDVLSLEREGSELIGNNRFSYLISPDDLVVINNPQTKEEKDAVELLKSALGENAITSLSTKGKLPIPGDRLTLIYYKKDDYRPWANPMLWRVIRDVQRKKLLQDMDNSVAESVINTVTIFALGDTANDLPATPEMYAKFASLLDTPTKSKNLIWNDLIKVIAEYPPVDKILGSEKYKEVDGDIRSGLGISEVLINGEGTNFSNAFLSVKTLTERLESAREVLMEWLKVEMSDIAKSMGFSKPPLIKLRHMSLKDEEAEKRLLLELVDRGMVSYETCIERFGENFDIELQRMKDEDDFRRKNEKKYPFTLIKTGKFGMNIANGPIPTFEFLDQMTIEDVMGKKQKQIPTSQEKNGPSGGRPKNTKVKQKKKQVPDAPVGQKTS